MPYTDEEGNKKIEEDYTIDYLVYSASTSLSEEKELWDYDLYEVVKRMMLKKFDGWIEWRLYK